MHVLAIFAHPDDMEINCGASIKLHSSLGHDVFCLVLTNGELGGPSEERVKEAKKAAEILGVKEILFLGMRDGYIRREPKYINIIRRYVRDFQPNLVYTHYPNDSHQDHINTFHLVVSAMNRIKASIFTCEGLSTLNFTPTAYNDITETLRYKIEALKTHRSQILRNAIPVEHVVLLARIRGLQIGVRFAEAFYPYRFIFLKVKK